MLFSNRWNNQNNYNPYAQQGNNTNGVSGNPQNLNSRFGSFGFGQQPQAQQNSYNPQMMQGQGRQNMSLGRQVMQSNNMSQNKMGQQQRQQMQQPRQQMQQPRQQIPQQMPQQMPQMQQPAAGQAPKLPAMGNQQPQNQQNQQSPEGSTSPFDNLKNIGTFMGYPEYTLPEFNPPQDSEAVTPMPGRTSNPEPPANNSYIDKVREFSQNERNGSEFYRHLAETARSENGRNSLYSIAERAGARSNRLKEWHNSLTKSEFTPESRNIRTDIGFHEGIDLAIREESSLLKNCAEIAETANDATLREQLNGIILGKLCQLNELNVLKND